MKSYLSLFLEMLAAEKMVAKNTIISYMRDLSDFSEYLTSHNYDPLTVSNSDLREYLKSLYRESLKAKSIARKISSLKQFFLFLYTDNYRTDNPALDIELPKQDISLPKVLTEKEVLLLLEQVYIDEKPETIRLRAILEILYASGVRITELVTLPLSAIKKFAGNTNSSASDYLLIKGKGNKERVVPLNLQAINAINQYLSVRPYFINDKKTEKWLFPSDSKEGHITRQRCGQLLKAIAVNVGIDPEKVSPHVIRHSFATHLLHNGADERIIQELLGHASINTVQIYTHINNKIAQDTVFNLHPLSDKKS